jgi:hypothetical protein
MFNGGNKVEKISNIRYNYDLRRFSSVCEHRSHAQFDLIQNNFFNLKKTILKVF